MSGGKPPLAKLIARNDYPPLSWLHSVIYASGLQYLRYRLERIPAVMGLYLTGSTVLGDFCHGISDIDHFVVIEKKHRDDAIIRSAIDLALSDAISMFPFLGPYKERSQAIVLVDENGAPDNLNFAYRSKTCSFKKVFQRKKFSFEPALVDQHLAVLSELNIQVSSVINTMRMGLDSSYFWKSKIRSLLILLFNQHDARKILDSIALSEIDKQLLNKVWSTANHQLYRGETSERAAELYGIFWKLVDLVLAKYKFDSLPETAVRISLPGKRKYKYFDTTLCEHEHDFPGKAKYKHFDTTFSEHEYNRGGLVLLDSMPESFELYDLTDKPYVEAFASLAKTLGSDGSDKSRECVVRVGQFAMRIALGDTGITNSFSSPFAFQNLQDGETIAFKQIVLQRMLDQARITLDEMAESLKEPVFDPKTSSTKITPYALLVEDDLKMLGSLFDAYRLSRVEFSAITLFRSVDDVLDELGASHSQDREFLELLRSYYSYLVDGKGAEILLRLPPNFFGYLLRLFAHYTFDAERPPPELLQQRLSLSLCVCSKDRARMLSELLDSVVKQARAPDEVVIIDNSDLDETEVCVRRFTDSLPIKYVRDKTPSLPALRNRALDESNGEIICFTDDDCVLDYQYLAHLERTFMRSNRIGAVGGVMRHLPQGKESLSEIFHTDYLG